jgi:glycosyltransferase involved in cell wall biosynthesis
MDKLGKPTVTVVIATYNRAHLLGRSIRSVLEQTYSDLELIVVDDASSDNTAEVVLHFDDKRVKYMRRETNGGPSAARNAGIIASTGEFVAFNDSDDEWLPDKLERQMGAFEIAPPQVGVVYCDFWSISDGGKALCRLPHITPEDGMVFRRTLAFPESGIWLGTAVVRRICFGEAGMLDETLHAFEDAELFMRVSKKYRLCHVSAPLVNVWATPGSVLSNHEALARALETILARYWDDIRVDRRLKTKYFLKLCWEMYLVGHRRKAFGYLARGLVTSPSECLAYLSRYVRQLSGERNSEHVTIGIAARAAAKFPQALFRMVIRKKPEPGHP